MTSHLSPRLTDFSTALVIESVSRDHIKQRSKVNVRMADISRCAVLHASCRGADLCLYYWVPLLSFDNSGNFNYYWSLWCWIVRKTDIKNVINYTNYEELGRSCKVVTTENGVRWLEPKYNGSDQLILKPYKYLSQVQHFFVVKKVVFAVAANHGC